MKRILLYCFAFFSFSFITVQFKLAAQSVTTTVQYNGAQANGCCTVCGSDYWCINNTGGCGTPSSCDTRAFFDPVPAGNEVTQVTINYYSAGCYGNTIAASINGSALPTVNEANTGCLCSNSPCAVSATATGNFPCGMPNYNYGANNNLQLCTGVDVCMDRVELVISYAPASTTGPPNQPGAITGTVSACTGTSLTYSISSVTNASSYTWSVPAGWSITSGQGSTSITTTVGGSSGNICVTADNVCGSGPASCLAVSPSAGSTDPTSASASPVAICSGSTTLSVSGGSLGSGASWNWYSGNCGLTFVGTGSSVSVSPSSTTTYYVRAEGGCNTTNCTSVTVTVNSQSTDPSGASASTNPTCGGSTTLSVSGGSLGTGANWNWYSTSCGGPSVGTGSSVSVSPSSTTTYFVQAVGTCNTTNCASVMVTVDPVATANAGSDGTTCGNATYNLAGAIGGSASGLTWSTSGTGTFNNTSLSNATYTPSAGDVSGGSITLTLTTNDPAGPCPAVSDNLVLTFEQNAIANAGSDNTICAGDPYALSGSIGGSATILSWSTSGSGTFDNATIPNATYTPSATDISTGSITLTLTTNDPPGSCTQATDNLILTISTAPTANAGADNIVCAGSSFALSGAFGGSATSSTWTTAGTGTFNNPALPNAIYTPSGADISAGTITLTLTTNDPPGSCTAASDNLILTIEPAATANAGADAFVCDGSAYTLSGSIGGSATNLNWTTSGTGTFDNAGLSNATYTPSGADISSGTVSLIITTNDPPGACNSVSDTIVLTINQLDDAAFSYSPASYCQSAPNPTPVISGLPGGTFSGVAGITVNSATGEIDLASSTIGGPYTITYTTNGTCPNSGTFDVFVTSSPDATFSYSTTQYCQNSSNPAPVIIPPASAGTFSASPAGLVFVSTSTGVIDIAGSSPGTYVVTNDIAAASGCPATSSTTTVQVIAMDDPSFSYPFASFCESATNPVPTVSGLPGGAFSEGSGNISINPATGEIDIVSSSVGGPYTVTYTTNGTCPDSSTVQLSINADGDPAFTYSSPSYCQSETDPVPTISGTSGGTFSGTAGLVFINPSTGEIDLSASTTGTYDITYNTGGPCADSSVVQITINPDFDATINAAGPFCESDAPVNMTAAQGGGTWSGNGITNPATGTFNPAVAGTGTHLITYDIAGICGNSDTVLVIVNQDADATITPVGSLCDYDSPVPLVAAQSGGVWSGTGVSGNNFDPSVSGPGTFVITYSIGGACGDTDTDTVTVNPGADATINAAGPFCETDLPVNLTAAQPGGIWSGTGITNTSTGTFNPSVSGGGTHLITYTLSGTCGNIDTTFVIVNPKQYVAPDTMGPYCKYSLPVTLTAVNPNPSDGWLGAGVTGNTFNPGLLGAAGAYPVFYTPAVCGPVDTVYMNVLYTPNADITGPDSSFCSNSTPVALTSVDPGGIWSGPGIQNSSTGLFDPSAIQNPPQTIQIIYAILGICNDYDTINIFINNVPAAPATVSDTACVVDDLVLYASGVNDSLNWYYDSAGIMILVHPNDTMFVPEPPTIDTSLADSVYIFYVQQQNGNCPSNYTPVTLTLINIGASFATTPADSGEIPLKIVFDNTSFGVDSAFDNFHWTFGDGDTSVLFNPLHTYEDTGDFTITLTVTDQYNVCKEIFTYTIHANGTSVVEVPNIFTPNGDGVNDVFNVIYKNLSSAEGVIYNRWGELIYRWSSVEAGWDGRTLSGTLAPDGVYYYIIKAVGKDKPEPDPKTYEFTGNVTLVR